MDVAKPEEQTTPCFRQLPHLSGELLDDLRAKAAAGGDKVEDSESFDSFVARQMEMHGEGKVPFSAVTRRKEIVCAYTALELQTVTDARKNGILDRLLENPTMLSDYAEESASDAAARCKAELQHLEELHSKGRSIITHR